MSWKDDIVIDNTKLPLNILLISFFVSIISFIFIVKGFFLLHAIVDKLVILVIASYIVYILFSALGLLINGNNLVRTIDINSLELLVENALHLKKIININQLSHMDLINKKWILFQPHFFKTAKFGINIYLKDGRYFRVSPHMERIDELRSKLEEIIENNRNSDHPE